MKKKLIFDNKELMKEWNWEKNNSLNYFSDKLTCGSNKKVWWKCTNCQNEWLATPHNRFKGTKCPICAKKSLSKRHNQAIISKRGSLQDINPNLAKEWDFEKNTPLKPSDVTPNSGRMVWWRCSKGHSWQSRIDHRATGSGCIYCMHQKPIQGENDLTSAFPELVCEWDYNKNGNLKPEQFMSNSNRKVWWICPLGHSWHTSISHRTSGTRCPKCYGEYGTSFAEQAICYYLSQYTTVENRITFNGYEIDIYLPEFNIGFEYDGKFYHSSENSKLKENAKDKYFNTTDIILYRIKESNINSYNKDEKIIYCIADNKYTYINYILEKICLILKIPFKYIDIKSDTTKIYSKYIKIIKNNSLANTHKELAKEWDYTKNENILPEHVLPGSTKKVWWVCNKCHSSYFATINHRVNGTKCPYCNGKQVNDTNNLLSYNPELKKFWNYGKNDISPEKVYFSSRKKVWWICPNCGKSFMRAICIMIKSKTYSCNECYHKIIGTKNQKLAVSKNGSLKHNNPWFLKEWDYNKNTDITPNDVSINSGKKVWWICSLCKKSWRTSIYNRTNGSNCPYCNIKKLKNNL